MKITIIGTGNVATVFAKLAFANGHDLVEIIARNEKAGKTLAQKVSASYNTIENINPAIDLIIIAVADNAIADIVIKLQPTNAIVVHTAGSVSINVLANKFENFGVLYPLQSLQKEMVIIPEVPLLLETNNLKTYTVLEEFSKSLSKTVSPIAETERLHLHTAAVIVNNFTNYLYTDAYELCQANKINFDLLLPLIKETANRIEHKSPLEMQTGPAKRNDVATIDKHLVLLESYPAIRKMYAYLSDLILNKYQNK
jgi:predicted short-subunit dehydrogenase-like oxidoreductase (DUF2520 family)